MNISKLCYELYKSHWKYCHVTREMEVRSIKNYFNDVAEEDMEDYTYEDYLLEQGYSGMMYVCYEEFLETEYLDKEYIGFLLDNDNIWRDYLREIKNH